MGDITKRGDYQFRARVRIAGYPVQVKTFETITEAEHWISDTEAAMRRGPFKSTSSIRTLTLGELCLKYSKEVSTTKKGCESEQYRLKKIADSWLGKMYVLNIDPCVIIKYSDWRLENGIAPGTVKRELGLLQRVYKISRTRFGYTAIENPMTDVSRPSAPRSRSRRPSRRELRWILTMIKKAPWLKKAILIAAETGMRRGNIAQVRPKDLNSKDRIVHLDETKNGSSQDVPLTARARDIIENLPSYKEGMVIGTKPASISKGFRRAVVRAREAYVERCEKRGIDPDPDFLVNLRLHDFRHDATSRFFEDYGLTTEEVMQITGHKDRRQLDGYTHLKAKKIVKKLG